MDALDVIRILARRWYLTVPLLACLAIASVTASGNVKLKYESSSDILVYAPIVDSVDPPPGGPFPSQLALGNASISLSRDDTNLLHLLDEGLSTDFEILSDRDGSIYNITATADTREIAVNTVTRIYEIFAESVRTVQEDSGISEAYFYSVRQITRPSYPTELSGDRIKFVAAVNAVGLALIIVIVLEANALLESRRRRRVAKDDPYADGIDDTSELGRTIMSSAVPGTERTRGA